MAVNKVGLKEAEHIFTQQSNIHSAGSGLVKRKMDAYKKWRKERKID